MQITISEKSKKGFEAAAQKLGLNTELPVFANIREDLALWLTAKYMLAVIIEAEKDSKTEDITNHSVKKYEPLFYAKDGSVSGSSAAGFSYFDYAYAHGYSHVGARLASNSREACKANAEEYLDLWEIVMLNVR